MLIDCRCVSPPYYTLGANVKRITLGTIFVPMADSAKHFLDSLLRRRLALRVEGKLDPTLAIQPDGCAEVD